MYETKSKSLWRRMAALCAAAVLVLARLFKRLEDRLPGPGA